MPNQMTPVPVRELGYASTAGNNSASWWVADDDFEETPELRWPLNLAVYDRMRRQDAQVGSVLRAVTSPIVRLQARIDGSGCDPRVVAHVASDLCLPVVGAGSEVPAIRTRDRFVWKSHMRHALLMLPFGHMVFEQIYRIDDQGFAHIRKLGPRMPRTIAKFNVARDGGLISIEQNDSSKPLPVSRLVVYVLDREGANWQGQSLLRSAYKNWLLKDRLLRVQTLSVERNGMGIPDYEAGPDEKSLDAGQKIASSIRAGDNSGLARPNGSKLNLLGVSGSLPDADKPIRYHDEQIARAVLAHFLNLGTQTGSWALGSTFADFFTQSLQAVADEIADTANAHIIEDLVDINYGPDEPAPRLVFDPIGSKRDVTAEAVKVLVDAGVLTADEDIEEFVRTTYGLPTRRRAAPEEATA